MRLCATVRVHTPRLTPRPNNPQKQPQSSLARPDLLGHFYNHTIASLRRVGLTSVSAPPPDVLHDKYIRHYKSRHPINEVSVEGHRAKKMREAELAWAKQWAQQWGSGGGGGWGGGWGGGSGGGWGNNGGGGAWATRIAWSSSGSGRGKGWGSGKSSSGSSSGSGKSSSGKSSSSSGKSSGWSSSKSRPPQPNEWGVKNSKTGGWKRPAGFGDRKLAAAAGWAATDEMGIGADWAGGPAVATLPALAEPPPPPTEDEVALEKCGYKEVSPLLYNNGSRNG
jgi:hypothetical protein